MCVLSPPPVSPGSSPSNPTPEPIPGLAATISTSPTSSPTPGPTDTSTASGETFFSLSPQVHRCATAGRSKAQRWCEGTPSPNGSCGSPLLTFKEALLMGGTSATVLTESGGAARQVTSTVPLESGARVSPRIVLFLATCGRPSQPHGPDADGFVAVEGRRARKERRRLQRPPCRPVPADLRGRCFNCFSLAHRAAGCRSSPRCYVCRVSGHRSYVCPRRRVAVAVVSKPTLVWRPISSAAPAAPPEPPMATSAPYSDVTAREQGRGRRRRVRRSRSAGNNAGQAPPSPSHPTDEGEEGFGEALPPCNDDRPATDES